jgi:hypothetical protein
VAKSTPNNSSDGKPGEETIRVDLKDRHFAAFLSWLVPGAGQWYQGRRGKAWLFFVCVLGTFLYGLFLGEGRVVYAQWEPPQYRRYSFLGQIGVGLPSLPALVGAARQNNGAETLPFVTARWYMPPRTDDAEYDRVGNIMIPNELDRLHRDLNRRFELGTVFTLIAGLLNVLVIYDAWAGPAYGVTRRKEASGREPGKPPDEDSSPK